MRLSLNIKEIKSTYLSFEMLYAFLPILSAYSMGGIPFALILSILLSVIAFIKTQRVWIYKPYLILIGYVFLHELILCMTMSALPIYHINLLTTTIIVLTSPVFIVPALKFHKFFKCILFVAIMSGIGMVYHYIIIRSGGLVTTITLPFLPIDATHTRLLEELQRPTSFFVEPAAFATFMMVPLFICLIRNKYLQVGLLLVVLFLSTSTTAVIESIVIIVTFLITTISRKYRFRAILLSLLFIAIGYFFINSSLFDATFQKIDETEVDENARLMNGLIVSSHLPIENFPFGINNANISDFVMNNNLQSFVFYGREYGTYLFVPTFWQILIKYGLLGIMLYLFLFYTLYKRDKTIIPYLMCLAAGWFFQGISLTTMFTWQICFISSYIYRDDEITFEFVKVVKESKQNLLET